MEGMRREMSIQDLGETEPDQEAEQQGDVVDAFVSRFEGGVHGGTPTRAGGTASLYRHERPVRKIQVEGREHGNDT